LNHVVVPFCNSDSVIEANGKYLALIYLDRFHFPSDQQALPPHRIAKKQDRPQPGEQEPLLLRHGFTKHPAKKGLQYQMGSHPQKTTYPPPTKTVAACGHPHYNRNYPRTTGFPAGQDAASRITCLLQVDLAHQSFLHADFGRFDREKLAGREMAPKRPVWIYGTKSNPTYSKKKCGSISSDLKIRPTRIAN
jgi:hypothetical protein